MADKSLGATALLITGFIVLLLGAILSAVLADQGILKTTLTAVDDEVVDIATAKAGTDNVNSSILFSLTYANTGGWKSETSDCDINLRSYGNDTTAYTLTTDYNVTTDGLLALKNTTVVKTGSNTTYVDYSYCSDEYLAEGWSRTILNIVPGFYVIGVLLVAVGIFFLITKKEGIF